MKKKELQEEIDRLRKQLIECHKNNESLYQALLECTCPASRYMFKYSPKMLKSAINSLDNRPISPERKKRNFQSKSAKSQ